MDRFSDIRLYRRGAAIALVREFIDRDQSDRLPRSQQSPVIVFTGPGKSALLGEIAQLMEPSAPCAKINCEDFTGGSRELLSLLAFELNDRSGRYRRVPFPRLITGLVAIRKVDLGDLDLDADRDTARARVRHVLEERRNAAKLLRDALGDAIKIVADTRGPATPDVSGITAVITRWLGPILHGSLAVTRGGRRVLLGAGQDWYGHQDRGLGRYPLDVLVDLNRMAARAGEEDRREVASLLWAAFLADLDAAFRRRRAARWTLNCLALLDNADTPAGREFLAELVAARGQRGPDPLTVVAASRGALAEQLVPRGEKITPLAQASAAHYRGGRWRWWYPVLLPDLAVTDVGAMVGRLDLPAGARRGGITSALYRYTDGHPVAVAILLDAIAEAPAGGAGAPDIDLATLLERRAGGAKRGKRASLADALLGRLLRDIPAEQVADLVTCSAARDREAALRLGAESGLLGQVWGAEAELFGAAFWRERSPGGSAVLHPVLRRLLLRRLAARPAGAGANWTVVHSWLRAAALASGDEAGALYHALALREVEHVGRRLAEAVETAGADEWLRLLEAVTAAPNDLEPKQKTVDEVGALTKWSDPRDLPAAPAGRLVAAMWIDADPLSDRHRPSLRHEIRADLHQIAPFCRNGIGTIREYADKLYADAPPGGGRETPEPDRPWPAPPKLPWPGHVRVLAAAAVIVLAAGAAAGIRAGVSGRGGPRGCAPAQGPFQVVTQDGECVGVTDGSYVFDPGPGQDNRAIADAEQRIAQENSEVVAKGEYVTVALMTVLTTRPQGSSAPSDVSLSRIGDELRGAYLAQRYANDKLRLVPRIRLLLANEGSAEQGWQTGWSQLRQIPAAPPGQLVAVAGMGISVQQSRAAARVLGAAGLPMFGAVITADGLDGAANPLLARVVPGVSEEVRGLAKYLPKPAKAFLVYDSQASDLYTSSLRSDFEQHFPGLKQTEIPYEPSINGSPLFKKIAQDLCYTPVPPLVFYAGRNSVFDQFLTQLEQEGDCRGKKLTIVTGSDANGLKPTLTQSNGGGAQVSVIYADIENTAAVTPGFTKDFRAWLGQIDEQNMADPWLLASYDAMTATADAIAEAEGSVTEPGKLTPGNVALWINQLNASASVNGATGTFSIGPGGDLENPVIPIVKLAAGKATTLTTIKDLS